MSCWSVIPLDPSVLLSVLNISTIFLSLCLLVLLRVLFLSFSLLVLFGLLFLSVCLLVLYAVVVFCCFVILYADTVWIAVPVFEWLRLPFCLLLRPVFG